MINAQRHKVIWSAHSAKVSISERSKGASSILIFGILVRIYLCIRQNRSFIYRLADHLRENYFFVVF